MGRPHGTEGAITVTDPTERVELLDAGRVVVLGGQEMHVAARRGTAEHPIVVLEGIENRAAAEGLRGEEIAVPRAALGTLAEGEFLVDDLIGCDVVDGGEVVGRVGDVLLLPSADALDVELVSGDRLLVPLVGDAVRGVDLDRRRVDVDMGFLA